MNWYGLEKGHSFLINLIRKKMNNLCLKIPSITKSRKKREEEERTTFHFSLLMNTRLEN